MILVYLRWVCLAVALFGTITSAVYLGLVIVAAFRFRSKRRPPAFDLPDSELPPVSVLKPVHGAEPLLDVNISSFFAQDYPKYELIFCARSFADPAFRVLDRVEAEHPECRGEVRRIESGEPPWIHPKTWSLDRLLEAAQYSDIVITDSDVRVEPHFLRSVVPYFADPSVGMVTCLYRGVPTGGPWSRLEALGMSVEMSSGVLVADMLEGMQFALGPCMATTKEAISRIGGLEKVAEYLADDFILGNWISKAGMKVVLADHVIEHVVTNGAFVPSMHHQLGWSRSTRFSRPKGHVGTALTFGMPYAVLGCLSECLLGDWRIGFALLLAGIAKSMVQTFAVGWGVVHDPEALLGCFLYPVRDLMGFAFWVLGYASNDVRFRGEMYELFEDGKIRMKRHTRSAYTGPTA